jgi:hypothetical protein
MDPCIIPSAHPDAWIDLLRGYTTAIVSELSRQGITVSRSWLDPGDPRDATILYTLAPGRDGHRDTRALVWDEETGWRTGRFVSGHQGVRTKLSKPAHIGGGLLPTGSEVALKIKSGTTAAPLVLRSHADTHDGLDDALWNQARILV